MGQPAGPSIVKGMGSKPRSRTGLKHAYLPCCIKFQTTRSRFHYFCQMFRSPKAQNGCVIQHHTARKGWDRTELKVRFFTQQPMDNDTSAAGNLGRLDSLRLSRVLKAIQKIQRQDLVQDRFISGLPVAQR